MFEFRQDAYRAMGPIEYESLASLAEPRLPLLHGSCHRSAHGAARIVRARLPLPQGAGRDAAAQRAIRASGDIHPADLSDLLARYHIDLIAERIESESSVVDLLDFDVRFGQGFLFSQPRPVRAEAMQANGGNGNEPPPRLPSINDPAAPKLVSSMGVVA